jgi:hypothetical protein
MCVPPAAQASVATGPSIDVTLSAAAGNGGGRLKEDAPSTGSSYGDDYDDSCGASASSTGSLYVDSHGRDLYIGRLTSVHACGAAIGELDLRQWYHSLPKLCIIKNA